MTNNEPELVLGGRFIRLMKRGKWEYVERVNARAVVGIVAVTEDGKLLLVEQLRVPLGKVVVELPAGLVGDTAGQEEEAMELAAQRELLEETGYEAASAEVVASGPSSAGLTNEVITIVVARGLKKVNAGGGVEGENITVHEVPLAEVPQRIKAWEAEGKLVDLKVFTALYFSVTGVSPVGIA